MAVVTSLLGVLTALVVIAITYLKWSHQYWRKRKVPYLPPRLPFGNWQNPRTRTDSVGVYMKTIYDEIRKRGYKHCGIYFFARPLYVVTDLDYLKNVMTKDFQYFVDRGMYYNEKDDPISAHLFALGGTKWKNLRTKLTPTFTSGKMKMMFPIMIECVSLLMDAMERECAKNEPVDIKEILCRFTTDIIGSCAFGLECNSIKEDDSPFRIYGKKVFTSTGSRSFKMTFASNFPALARFLGIRQIPEEISDFFTRIVKDTVEYRENNQFERNDFMQLLIKLKNGKLEDAANGATSLTIEEVVAQSFVFFLAGFETSSTTMTFALYELAKNPDIQDRLRKEIDTVLAEHNGKMTYESVAEMKYLGQVIDETLRLYPPVPFVSRICVKDYRIPDEDVVIEKGTRVILPIMGVHLDEEYYPEPEVFDPDRFSEENKRGRHQYTHIPFGEGPRICIGMRFGLMQSKVGLASIVKNYNLKVSSKTKEPLTLAKNSFVLNANGGIWLDVHRLSKECS